MLITKEYIENWLKLHWDLLVQLHIAKHNALRLKENRFPNEEIVKKHGFFSMYFEQMKLILAIQLSKFFSKSDQQKLSFRYLFNVIKNNDFSEEFKDYLKSHSIDSDNLFHNREEVIQCILNLENKINRKKKIIKKLEDARNKVYAHTDPLNQEKPFLIPISDEYAEILKLCEETYNVLRVGFFDTTSYFDIQEQWNLNPIEAWEIDPILKSMSIEYTNRKNKRHF